MGINMSEPNQSTFQKALSNLTFEAACGGAIRHLADNGYTAKQIMERLDYPISYEHLRTALYQHLRDTCVILEESPDKGLPEAKPKYVLEYNEYGKPSYRRVKDTERESGSDDGTLTVWREVVCKAFPAVSGQAYLSCDFGIADSIASKGIPLLNGRQREYIEGVLWPGRRVYHKLDQRMREILCSLYEQGFYEGICYLPERKEIYIIERLLVEGKGGYT